LDTDFGSLTALGASVAGFFEVAIDPRELLSPNTLRS
jgi:hypothetical protein